jgi:hypothetical protein
MPRSDLGEGRRVIEEAAAMYGELGDEAGLLNTLWGRGNVFYFGAD